MLEPTNYETDYRQGFPMITEAIAAMTRMCIFAHQDFCVYAHNDMIMIVAHNDYDMIMCILTARRPVYNEWFHCCND